MKPASTKIRSSTLVPSAIQVRARAARGAHIRSMIANGDPVHANIIALILEANKAHRISLHLNVQLTSWKMKHALDSVDIEQDMLRKIQERYAAVDEAATFFENMTSGYIVALDDEDLIDVDYEGSDFAPFDYDSEYDDAEEEFDEEGDS